MKKAVIFIIISVLVFIAVYFAMSFLIPGLRIKLEAEPFTLFVESLKSMMFFKALISLAAGAAAGGVFLLIARKKR